MNRIKILILFFVTTIQIFGNGGSPYTRYGFGDLRTTVSARRFGFGELGVSLTEKDFLSTTNPAAWTELHLTRFETGFSYFGNSAQSSSSSVFHSNTFFNGLLLGLPVDHDLGLSAVIGLVPFSSVAYEVTQQMTDPVYDAYNVNYKGDGGLSKIIVGASYKLPLDISFGLSYDYYVGSITKSSAIQFNTGASYKDATYRTETSYQGMGITAGLISGDLSKIFGYKDITDFKIGIVFSPSISINADSTNRSSTVVGTFTTSSGTTSTSLPSKFSIGTSLKLFDKYTFLLDYLTQPYSNVTYAGLKSSNMQDFSKASFGFEFRNPQSFSNTFWESVSLRCGISYEKSQYSFNGVGINQFSLYGGLSMPIGFDNSFESFENTIDLGFQYGRRGTTDNNLLQENIYKFTVSMSIGSLWFLRPER